MTAKEMKAIKTRIGTQKQVSKHHAQSMYSAQEDVNLKHWTIQDSLLVIIQYNGFSMNE